MQRSTVPVRVFLVDDHEIVRRGVAEVLEEDPGIVVAGEAGSVAEALEYADARHPDVVLVDVGLPDGDGFSLTQQLRVKPWEMRVVIFSSDADPANSAAAARAGAISFFPKDELLSPALQRLIEDRTDEDQ